MIAGERHSVSRVAGNATGRVSLADKARIERVLGTPGLVPSEYCFANIYLFRERHAYRIMEDPTPHLRGTTYDGAIHALPLAPLDAAAMTDLAQSGIDCIYPLSSEPPGSLMQSGWQRGFVQADSDYWYDGAAMAQMRFTKGRRAQGLAFAAEFQPIFEWWSDATVADGLAVLEGWLGDVGRDIADTDFGECLEAISLVGDLGLEGALVRTAQGDAAAFLLASQRDDGVRVIHFAKGRRAYSGAYPWLFAEYARESGAKLLNFEQDLGNPGLAQSKRSYRPIEQRKKWRLVAP
jgi:uncharacterized protein